MDRTDAAVAPTRGAGALLAQVEQVRASTGATPAKSLRRLLFFWLRVYVRSTKRGKVERVNVAIPIPIPLVGIMFPGRLNWNQALQVAALADDPERAQDVGQYLESCMGLELVRVEQDHPERQHHELVVVGLDGSTQYHPSAQPFPPTRSACRGRDQRSSPVAERSG